MENGFGAFIGTFCAWVVFGFIGFGLWGCPQYNVYSSGKAGEAELAQAEYNRQVAVKEAEAKKAAAVDLADAEVTRAKGVAQANKIIGDSLKDNPDYLNYLWITDVATSQKPSVIYVPSQGGIPLLEAGRHPPTDTK